MYREFEERPQGHDEPLWKLWWMDVLTDGWTEGGMDGCVTDDRDASGRQGVAVTQNSIHQPGLDTSTTADATAAAANLRSQISELSAKNIDPLFPFFPEQRNPEVSGRQMLEVRLSWKKMTCGWEIIFWAFC